MLSVRQTLLGLFAGAAISFGVAGCAPEHPDVIPTSAQLSDSGEGMVHFTAPHDGMVYVYDQTGQRLVWSGNLLKGESVDVEPTRNRIMMGGTVVANKILNANSRHEVYFDPSSVPSATPVYNTAPNYNNGVLVTPSATVQPTNSNGTVTVQPGLNVTPTLVPAPAPQPNPHP